MTTEGNANRLFDTLIEQFHLKSDASLSRALGVSPPVISKIRHGKLPVGALLIISIHETYDIPIRTIKRLCGLPVPAELSC